jgi:hypothetical protein
MSRTAGLGTGDYASINSLAVASLFFGIASVMVIYGWLLLPIPLVAAILAVAALRQIRNSGGTQVGWPIAAIGLLLALGFGGWQLASGAIQASQTRADRDQILKLIDRLSQDAAADNLSDAYSLFGPKFQAAFTPELFDQQFKIREVSPYYGKIKSIQWNGRMEFDVTGNSTGDGNDLEAVTLVKVNAQHLPDPARARIIFRKIDGQWVIDTMPEWFVPPTPKPVLPGSGAPQGPPAPR